VPLLECCRAWACLRVSSLGEAGQSLHASLVANGQWLIARDGPGHSWLISAPNMVHDCVVNVLMAPACGAGDTGSSEQRLEPQHVLRAWTNATTYNALWQPSYITWDRSSATKTIACTSLYFLIAFERHFLPFREICCLLRASVPDLTLMSDPAATCAPALCDCFASNDLQPTV